MNTTPRPTRRTVTGLGAAAALGVLAGCGRPEEEQGGAAPAEPIAEGPATGALTVWAMGAEGEALPELLKGFEEENPDVTVEVTPIPWDSAHDKFTSAIAAGTAPDVEEGADAIMPYYGRPLGLEIDGEAIEEVGFGFNRQILTGLLRGELGYDGVIVSDWELVNDNHVGDQVLPARAWGVEELTPSQRMQRILEAGADQFGGEECTELLLGLVRDGLVSKERVKVSARRLLLVKFRLGLFDDPYVDESAADSLVGTEESRRKGHEAQAHSVVVLHDDGGALPLAAGSRPRIYAEGLPEEVIASLGEQVAAPAQADVALVRIGAPFQPRDDLFLEAWFHQGDLEYPPGLAHRLDRIRAACPLILDVDLDRAAVLTGIVDHCDALTGSFGVSGAAWVDAITGAIPARGRLPIDLPRSMEAVRRAPVDVPGGTADPLYPAGHGVQLGSAGL